MGHIAERIRTLNPDWKTPKLTTGVQYLNALGWLPKLDLGGTTFLLSTEDTRYGGGRVPANFPEQILAYELLVFDGGGGRP